MKIATAPMAATSDVKSNPWANNTAMSTMAIRSSMTASANRNTRMLAGSPRPTRAINPSANAMSVATGMGQPRANSGPAITRYTIAGTATPATAAIAGASARDGEFNSPRVSSCRSSTATMKKKSASSPSVIQWLTLRLSDVPAIVIFWWLSSMRPGPATLLARTSPSTAATRSDIAE